MSDFEKDLQNLRTSIGSALLGKEEAIELTLTCLLAQGHLLIEDVPGVGKTTLALALAQSIDCSFQRIQFTSDLLPSDVIGVPIFNSKTQTFEFHPGPLFANIVLADEINRTTPKTQSALLEAMQDGQVTVERITHPLEKPFMVIATQNSIEFHGTYPLPESQLDRFLMRITLGYPNQAKELEMIQTKGSVLGRNEITAVCTKEKILQAQQEITQVQVKTSLSQYIVNLVEETRRIKELELGVSPRGALALFRASQARAFIQGRNFVVPDDIKSLAIPVLAHRFILSGKRTSISSTQDSKMIAENILRDVLNSLEVPM